MSHNSFFVQKSDATGLLGVTTDLKLYKAIQMLADDFIAFSMKWEVRTSEAQNIKCIKQFSESICKMYRSRLCRHTVTELQEIDKRYKSLGFPGCVGAVDFAGWGWENCSVAWQGLFGEKDGDALC